VDQAKSRIKGAGFDAVVSTNQVPSSCPAGTAAGTSPDGRTIKGGVVMIQVSSGAGSTPPTGNPPTNPGRPPSRPGG
jgi:beta-lactam-binding protein with PASTA domain